MTSKMPVISIQGEPESYSYKTVVKRFGQSFVLRYRKTFRETFEDVKCGESDYALLPFINFITGEIPENYRLVSEYGFYIHEAITTKLDHALLGKPGLTLNAVQNIYSHQQALAQCSDFLKQEQLSKVKVKEVHDTAGAKLYLDNNPESSAIIASKSSAKALGLEVLSFPVQNSKRNKTTFFLVSTKLKALSQEDNLAVLAAPSKTEEDAQMLFDVKESQVSILRIFAEKLPHLEAKTYFFAKFTGDPESRRKLYSLLRKENLFSYMSGMFSGTL